VNRGDWIKSRRLYFPGLFAVFAVSSILLRLTSSYTDYYTLFGFHLQKQGLSSLLLVLALLVVFIPAYVNAQVKGSKISLLVSAGGLLLYTALVVPRDIIKFNQRVNNGTLVERHGNTTPLMMAAYKGDLLEMKRLIQNGANVNARNDVNNSALHFAAGATPIENQIYRGSPEAVAYLIQHGADVNAQNKTGITPLMDAIYNNNLESLKILLAHGADVNRVSKYNETALSAAIIRAAGRADMFGNRYRDMAIELLQHGADPNFKDFTGRTPLKAAERFHENGLVEELKKYGAKE
jgi:uncharacterized protein